MRRVAIAAALSALLVPMLLSSGAGGAAPGRLGVDGFEYSLTMSKRKLDPGRAIVEFRNAGEDAHNLLLKRKGGSGEVEIAAELEPGGVAERTVKLRRDSRYRLWCSLPAPQPHDTLGMNAVLRIRNHG